MNAQSGKRIEMAARVLKFNTDHPDTDAGYALTAAKLEQLLKQAEGAAAAQREGLVAVRAASARKEALRRAILAVPIAHLAAVGRAAAREEHELGSAFRFKPGRKTFLAFRTSARTMLAAGQTHREVLVKHGLSESVLEQFGRMLDEFDAAVALGIEGRTKHMGATAELRLVAAEIARTVRVMDGRNRQRFQEDGQLLASWLSARAVLGTPRGGSPGAGPGVTPVEETSPTGEERPAA
jgi:hypothetical protein